ncbi:mitochondrial protein Pet127-domain-containing protein [Hyaloraphidium curvatum]|nr:mitochondrial protein Pet127-domain-containing protein [Hyaloraphidium curvatum]
MSKTHGSRYCGSTSSMTSLLSQFCFLLTQHKPIDTRDLSAIFESQIKTMTKLTRAPTSVIVNWKDGCYAIDAEKPNSEADDDQAFFPETADDQSKDNMILAALGKIMEKQLTLPEDEFRMHLLGNSDELVRNKIYQKPEAFHFATASKFMLRAQLDCYDTRLPKGSFDLKTRALLAIRMDQENYRDNLVYRLKKTTGLYESFEREYYDMLRSAFLKYSLQVRIGNMDGIFVCYHNTDEIFGFQYIPLETMDEQLFGSTLLAEQTFRNSLLLLERLLDRATAELPGQSFRLTLHAKENQELLVAFVQSIDDPDTIMKYSLVSRSAINGIRQRGPFNLTKPDDKWTVFFKIEDGGDTRSPAQRYLLRAEYEKLRSDCVNLMDKAAMASRTNSDHLMNRIRKVFQQDGAGQGPTKASGPVQTPDWYADFAPGPSEPQNPGVVLPSPPRTNAPSARM